MSDPEIKDFTRPHPNFSYGVASILAQMLDLNGQDRSHLVGRFLWQAHPNKYRLYKNSHHAIQSWINLHQLNSNDIINLGPNSPEWNDLAIRSVTSTRSPQEFFSQNLDQNCKGLIIGQPNRMDGLYWPEDLFRDFFEKLFSRHPNLPVLVDERQALFCQNEVSPSSCKDLLDLYPSLSLYNSSFPVYCPQGPEIAWILNQHFISNENDLNMFTNEQLHQGLGAVITFHSRQGQAILEFKKKITILNRGLREWADITRPLREMNLLTVPHWPDAGFTLVANIKALLGSQNSNQYCQEFLHNHQIQLISGEQFGQPGHIAFCFARPMAELRRLARALVSSAIARGAQIPGLELNS